MLEKRKEKTKNVATSADVTTRDIYNEAYFQGGKAKSNYDNYVEQSRGPTEMLADTLYEFFRPSSVLDAGCAVGHSVKRLRLKGVDAYGIDISDWAVGYADVPYVRQADFSERKLSRMFDLVYSYDVVEHIVPERLNFAVRNLWAVTKKDLLVVPATYENGETHDPNEPTHLTFKPRNWWIDLFESEGCSYDVDATQRFQKLEHSRIFNYADRIMIFSRREQSVVNWGVEW